MCNLSSRIMCLVLFFLLAAMSVPGDAWSACDPKCRNRLMNQNCANTICQQFFYTDCRVCQSSFGKVLCDNNLGADGTNCVVENPGVSLNAWWNYADCSPLCSCVGTQIKVEASDPEGESTASGTWDRMICQ